MFLMFGRKLSLDCVPNSVPCGKTAYLCMILQVYFWPCVIPQAHIIHLYWNPSILFYSDYKKTDYTSQDCATKGTTDIVKRKYGFFLFSYNLKFTVRTIRTQFEGVFQANHSYLGTVMLN